MARKKFDNLEVVVWDSETQGEGCISQAEIQHAFKTTMLTKLRKSKAFRESPIKKTFMNNAFRKFRTKYYRDNFKPEMFSCGWLKIADCVKTEENEWEFINKYDILEIMKMSEKDKLYWLDKIKDDVEVIDDGDVISKLLNAFPNNTYAYAYNSSGWDSHFLLSWLLEESRNYIDISRSSGEDLKKIKNNFNNKYVDGVFEIVCDDKNKIYELSIERWKITDKGAFKQHLVFQCAWLKFPGSIKKFGKEIGLFKGDDFDYTMNRPEKYILTPSEIEYQKRDVVILAVAVSTFSDVIGHNGFAVAGGALRLWKQLRYKHIMDNEKYVNYIEKIDENGKMTIIKRDLRKKIMEKAFKEDYPNAKPYSAESQPFTEYDEKGKPIILNDLDIWNDDYMNWQHAKESYMGGITFLNKKYKNILITNNPRQYIKKYPFSVINNVVIGYDISSSYPSNMKDKELPYGHYKVFNSLKEWGEVDYTYGFAIFEINIKKASLKYNSNKDRYIPFFPKKGGVYGSYTYVEEVINEHRYISNIDLSNLMDFYDIEFDIVRIFAYKTKFYQFEEYVNLCYEMKESTYGVEKEFWKVLMNSLYGKFGMGYTMCNRYWYRDENGFMDYEEFDNVGLGIYMPMACSITSWARDNLINAIQFNCARFIYCDTDSLYLIGKENPIGILLTKDYIGIECLGKWALEGIYDLFIASRPKVYIKRQLKDKKGQCVRRWVLNEKGKIIQNNNIEIVKFAGCRNVPSTDYLIESFINNQDFLIPKGKVQSINCKKGGKVILNIDYTYTIKNEYNEIEELQNLAIEKLLNIDNNYVDIPID